MFRHLRTKLTVLYGGLFAAILILIAVLVLAAVSDNAQRAVRKALDTSGLVFDRIWAQRAAQLQTDGVLLSRDFGFRTAVATRDTPTIRSSLENLRMRLRIDGALMIGPDGSIVSAEHLPLDAPSLRALQSDDVVSGVLTLGGSPFEAVSVPIDGGAAGWVVIAAKLDQAQMRALQAMAAIPLKASVAYRTRSGQWRDNALDADAPLDVRTASFLDKALSQPKAPPGDLDGHSGKAMATARPLVGLVPDRPVMLLLQYPLAEAMAPYRALLGLLVATGAIGFAILVAGAWTLARTVTRPVSLLEEAARRLQRGERARVEVQTQDEIGHLAETFNVMASEIRQREDELIAARDEAEAANRAKSSFLTNMSHEVRTPLHGVIGVAGVLSGTTLTPDQKQLVSVISNSASVLQRVLDDVLDLARVEAGRLDIIREPFDFDTALRALADGAALQCRAKRLAFELAADAAHGVRVVGDRVRLEQILGNLLSNAVKFTERGGVGLSVTRAGESGFRFEVRDTGIGFDPHFTEELFKPFQQADGTITRRYGGSGLGLSISRELAQAMGGALTATSRPGEGAVFTLDLDLPAAEPAPAGDVRAHAPSAPETQAADDPRAPRVLVVDDHETNRMVARLTLEGAGVEVVVAEDGAQAVSAWLGDAFDVVFMDMQMPVMDGLEAIRRMREHERASARARTPIFMLSANAMPEHLDAARAAGADGHLAKPITPPRLIAAVVEALDGPAQAPDVETQARLSA